MTSESEKGKRKSLKLEMDEKSYSYADISSLSSPNSKEQEDSDFWSSAGETNDGSEDEADDARIPTRYF